MVLHAPTLLGVVVAGTLSNPVLLSCGDDDITNFISSIASNVKIQYPALSSPVQHTPHSEDDDEQIHSWNWTCSHFMFIVCAASRGFWQSQAGVGG